MSWASLPCRAWRRGSYGYLTRKAGAKLAVSAKRHSVSTRSVHVCAVHTAKQTAPPQWAGCPADRPQCPFCRSESALGAMADQVAEMERAQEEAERHSALVHAMPWVERAAGEALLPAGAALQCSSSCPACLGSAQQAAPGTVMPCHPSKCPDAPAPQTRTRVHAPTTEQMPLPAP